MQEEVWKDVVGYEGTYMVSNTGKVKSLDRYISHYNSLSGTAFKKGKGTSIFKVKGYIKVSIMANGKKKDKFVHRLVAEAFIPNPNNYPQLNHINGIKEDNTTENLEWCTAQQNVQHSWDNGLCRKIFGVRKNTKLKKEQVKDIKNLWYSGVSKINIHSKYSHICSYSNILKICSGNRWGTDL